MLRRILIGIDSTGSNIAAQRLGVRWAKRSGATLAGLGIVDEPGIRAIEPAWPSAGNQALTRFITWATTRAVESP